MLSFLTSESACFVCVSVCGMCVCLCLCVWSVCAFMFCAFVVCMCECMFLYMCVCVCLCVPVCVCVVSGNVYLCGCVYMIICVCLCVSMYVCTAVCLCLVDRFAELVVSFYLYVLSISSSCLTQASSLVTSFTFCAFLLAHCVQEVHLAILSRSVLRSLVINSSSRLYSLEPCFHSALEKLVLHVPEETLLPLNGY